MEDARFGESELSALPARAAVLSHDGLGFDPIVEGVAILPPALFVVRIGEARHGLVINLARVVRQLASGGDALSDSRSESHGPSS